MQERLQKILARAGYGSRRSCEELISAGRVTVNGKIAGLGDKADPRTDQIAVDLVPLPAAEKLIYVALYKPRHVLSATSTLDGRRTVRDLVDLPERIYPVGRLDFESEGLVLLTNDGELANRLSHPRYGHEKEYHVLVARRPDQQQLETWRRGVVLEDGYKTAPARVTILETVSKGAWLEVVLKEGRKRQIREVGSRLGLPVLRIIRTRIGSLKLGKLKPGEWRHLTPKEIQGLKGRSVKSGSSYRKERAKPEKSIPVRPTRSRPGKSRETGHPQRRPERDEGK